MSELVVLGESLRRDLEDWLHAQCAGWLPDDHVQIDGLEAVQAIAADTAALLSACYQAVALDAWLTAGYLPAERAVFDEQVTAMALADGGVDATVRGSGAAARSAVPAGTRAWLDPAGASGPRGLDTPRPSDEKTVSDTGTISDTWNTPEMPARAVTPVRDIPAAPAIIAEAPQPASAAAGVEARPVASGFQRLRGLHELAARAQSLDGAGSLPEATRHLAAAPRSPSMSDEGQGASPADLRAETRPRAMPAEPTTAAGPTTRPVRPAPGATPGATPGARPGAEPDELSIIESASELAVRTSSAVRDRTADTPGILGRGDGSSADAGAGVGLDELRAHFRPLMERTAGAADASWPAAVTARATHAVGGRTHSTATVGGQGRSGPAQLSRHEPEAASGPEPAPEMSMAGAEPAFAGVEPATPPARAAQRARASEQAFAATPAVDELLPSDVESILEAITEDLERDFARLYGGG